MRSGDRWTSVTVDPADASAKRVSSGAVTTTEDRHRQAGEARQMRFDQVGHFTAEGPLGRALEFATARPGGHQHARVRNDCAPATSSSVQIQPGHLAVELQAVTQDRGVVRQCVDECLIAVRRGRHVAHLVGDLVDLAPDLVGALEHHDIELDVEALDGCAHARRPGSDYDHVVECFGGHPPRLRPWPGPMEEAPVGCQNSSLCGRWLGLTFAASDDLESAK